MKKILCTLALLVCLFMFGCTDDINKSNDIESDVSAVVTNDSNESNHSDAEIKGTDTSTEDKTTYPDDKQPWGADVNWDFT